MVPPLDGTNDLSVTHKLFDEAPPGDDRIYHPCHIPSMSEYHRRGRTAGVLQRYLHVIVECRPPATIRIQSDVVERVVTPSPINYVNSCSLPAADWAG